MKIKFFIALIVCAALIVSCGSKDMNCPLCNGSGNVSAQGLIVKCPICKGDGEISKSKFADVTERKTCSACNGAGLVAGLQCSICHGQGNASELQIHQWLCTPVGGDSSDSYEDASEHDYSSQTETCPSCHGSGRCQVCKGMGYSTGFSLNERHSCKACWHSGGETYDGDGKCQFCKGTGRVSY